MPLFRRFSKRKAPTTPAPAPAPVPANTYDHPPPDAHGPQDPPSYHTEPPLLFRYHGRSSRRSSRYEDPNPYARSYRQEEEDDDDEREEEEEETYDWDEQRHAGSYRQPAERKGDDVSAWDDAQEERVELDPCAWAYEQRLAVPAAYSPYQRLEDDEEEEEHITIPASFPYHQQQNPNPYPSYPQHQQQQQQQEQEEQAANSIPYAPTEPAQPQQPEQPHTTPPFLSQTSTPTTKKPDSLRPIPSQIPRLTEILAINPSDPSQARLIRKLPFPLKLPRPARKRLFADTTFCAAHAAITPPYVFYLLDLVGEELWPRLRRLLSSPLTPSACTRTFIEAVKKWRPFFRPEDIGQPGRPCGVCTLGAFWRDENARDAVGMLARGRQKKGRDVPEIVTFVGEGVDRMGMVDKGWRKGAVWDVLHDRKMIRRWEKGEEVMGVEGPRERATQ